MNALIEEIIEQIITPDKGDYNLIKGSSDDDRVSPMIEIICNNVFADDTVPSDTGLYESEVVLLFVREADLTGSPLFIDNTSDLIQQKITFKDYDFSDEYQKQYIGYKRGILIHDITYGSSATENIDRQLIKTLTMNIMFETAAIVDE